MGVGLILVLLHVAHVRYTKPVVGARLASAKSMLASGRMGAASGVKQVVA